MKALWTDCAIIVNASADEDPESLELIECHAEDIARKAGQAEALWKDLLEGAQALESASGRRDWVAADESYQRINRACCNCHIEYQSLEQRGFTQGMLESWLKRERRPFHDFPEEPLSTRPDHPFRSEMRQLLECCGSIVEAIDRKDPDQATRSAGQILKTAEFHRTAWQNIHREAENIRRSGSDFNAIRAGYQRLSVSCVGCHAVTIPAEQERTHPPVWDK
jgi:hypothetical protein